jgi:EmrB/QacA subfamily drug resistance transporter
MTRTGRATLVAASLGTAMLLLDVTVVYVALPAIAADLHASFAEVQWVVDAYAVVLAATLLGAGVLADRTGRRRTFAWGVVLFSGCSALCAFAGNGLMLDLARAAQGVGAAAIFSASLALLAHQFRGAARGRALGLWGAVTGAALAVGPLVGGLVVDGLNWRWIFLINIPLGAVLLALTLRAVPESRARDPEPIDLPGAAAFALACLLLALGLTRGNDAGWSSPWIIAALGGAALCAATFVVVESRSRAPMLPLALFRIPAFSGTAIVAFAQSVAIYPLLIFLAIYLQDGLGYSPTGAGLRLLPLTLLILVVAPFAGRLSGRLALRIPLVTGLVLLGVALLLLHGLGPGDGWTALLPGMLVGGLAIGAISPSLAAAMVSVLPVERSGMSSGVNNTFRQLGIAMGVAGLGAIFDAEAARAAGRLAGIVDGVNAVALVSSATAFLGAAVAWPLLGPLRADRN